MNMNQSGRTGIYPQDLLQSLPPRQEGKWARNSKFSAFAVSLQGSSHVQKGIPCQDYSDIRILDGCGIIIGGIADGVGSCPLSHWGAYIAVNEALNYVEDKIRGYERAPGEPEINQILNDAFRYAEDMVAGAADAAGQAVHNLQSTLTVAVYDGSNLYCCHVGDDGVVAQQQNGEVKLATNRLKGEEASSVYPLQTGNWEVTKIINAVAGFVMATDGVLDAFALMYPDYDNINYFNRIYYPFMEPALYGMTDKTAADAARKTLEFYQKYLKSEGYRAKVTDDLTLVAVTAPAVLEKSVHPKFDAETWNNIERENERKKAVALGYTIPQSQSVPETVPNRVPEYLTVERTSRSPAYSTGDPARRSSGRLLAEEDKVKKKRSRKSPGDHIFLLFAVLVTLIVVLIAAIAVLGFLYFKKPFKTGDTETSDKIVSEEMTEELIATIEETVKLEKMIKATDSNAVMETDEEQTKEPQTEYSE